MQCRPTEEPGSPVNLACRSGVLDKLSVTAEMSTTAHSDEGSEVGSSKGRDGGGWRENGEWICGCVSTGLLLFVNGSVEKGGFERQNKLMEGEDT